MNTIQVYSSAERKHISYQFMSDSLREIYDNPNIRYTMRRAEVARVLLALRERNSVGCNWFWSNGQHKYSATATKKYDGSITVGCQKFSKAAVAKISRWAFAKRKRLNA